jgi:hypothetical protein
LQRFRAIHHSRTLYAANGTAKHSDGRVVIQAWDRNAIRTLERTFGRDNLEDWNDDGPTCHLVNCGLTHYGFGRAVAYSGINLRNSMEPTEFKLIRAQRPTWNLNRVEIEFTMKLRTLTHLSVTPAEGLSFNSEASSIYTRESYQNGRSHFISRVAFGRQLNETQHATVILEVKF